MKVKRLKELLSNMDDNADCVFAETQDSRTVLWRIEHCCNTERQEEFGQVWFYRGSFATDLMAKNDAIFEAEQMTNTEIMVIYETADEAVFINGVLDFQGTIDEAKEYARKHSFGGGVEVVSGANGPRRKV